MGFAVASVANRTRTTLVVVSQLMLDILAGLAYLHGESIIHCRIKPANILLSNGDLWEVANFRLAKKLREPRVTDSSCDSR